MTVGNTHKISTAGGTKGWVAYLLHLLESRVCGQWILLFNHTEYCTIVAESHCNCCHNSCSGKCTAYKYPGWWVISTPWKIISTLWWYVKKHDWNTSISHRRVCVCHAGTPEVNHVATAVIYFVSGNCTTYCCSEWWFELVEIPCWWKNWYQRYRWKWGKCLIEYLSQHTL